MKTYMLGTFLGQIIHFLVTSTRHLNENVHAWDIHWSVVFAVQVVISNLFFFPPPTGHLNENVHAGDIPWSGQNALFDHGVFAG